MTTIRIFYAWQSDTDKGANQKAIEHALDQVKADLESKIPDIEIVIDQATAKRTGSPHIATSIFEKISAADIFVGDITTITDSTASKPTPNPNVLIELGYAIPNLGWDRIVLLFNKAFGNFPKDTPFDISGHRINAYSIKDGRDRNGKADLKMQLTLAVESIIITNPTRGSLLVNKEQVKRKHDIKTLTQVLSNIHLPSFQQFLSDAPRILNARHFHYWDGFRAIMELESFYLYDKKLHAILVDIYRLWETSLSYNDHYRQGAADYSLLFGQTTQNWATAKTEQERHEKQQYYYSMKQKESADLEVLEKTIADLREKYKEFIHYIKEHYLEVNLEETNKAAMKSFKSYY